ncbi:MAG: 3-deoxy-D-manno-octulosonic acid kinase [Candidimonas sp.]|nr:MAG: 3-deoxy-D-manno-octulosonic acid kinase [Candidimonas sp.]TAM25011.1 MAG: 3-deoxy-D-manno-octulosonic acid kinase [Candidimonas sp.]TAM73830.1 MAG: 3-deoxy-D-manno-octulosonic acid kinase [Candidimonas sp.]
MRLAAPCSELGLPNGTMRFDPGFLAHPGAFLFDPGAPQNQATPVQVGGRQAAWFTQGEYGAGVLRHYRRGGLVARLSRDRYVWAGEGRVRSFAEFELLRAMRAEGLPVPAPLAAVYWRCGMTYRAAILIERLPHVQTLAKALDQPSHQAVADAIFSMHQAGVWHADLNAYNILLDDHGKAWLIDFDRGHGNGVSPSQRQNNLRRLRRSLEKVAGPAGIAYWETLDKAYRRCA